MLTVNFREKGRTPLEQLLNVAQSSKLYDQDVLNALNSNDDKLRYLEMLSTANALALDTRMQSDGYDYQAIENKQLKFYALETEYELAIQEKLNADEQYQNTLAQNYSAQLNEQFSKDTRISGNNAIKTVVDTKYSGNYSQFMSEYKDDATFFGDEYLAYADSYDEEETRQTLKYMQESAGALKSSQDATAQLLARKTALLENIALDKQNRIKREAFENASWVAKAGASTVQLLVAPVTEIGNVFEGLIDAVAVTASGIGAALGFTETSQDLLNFAATDTIPLDTLLAEALPNSYITSPYAKNNPLQWLYEIETSIIDMIPMALNVVAPGVGTFLYYASSAGRTAESYANENLDAGIGEIVAYTAASTAIEVLTEKLSGDVVFGKGFFDKWDKLAKGHPALSFIKEMAGEGLEEVASEIGSQLTASILRGENKFDGKQILKAGALGAATSMFLQGGSIVNKRRRLLGINTRLTNTTSGIVLDLSARESAIVTDFMERSQSKLDTGKTLSAHDQQLYDTFKTFDFRSYLDSRHRRGMAARIDTWSSTVGQYDSQMSYNYDTESTVQSNKFTEYVPDISGEVYKYTDRVDTRYEIEQRDGRNIIRQTHTTAVWERRTQPNVVYDSETSTFITSWNNFVNVVDSGLSDADLDAAAREILSDELTESFTTEMQQMASVWTNSLLSADENNQAVLTAVNNYYNGVLENIADRMTFTPSKLSDQLAPKLSTALNANVTITTEKGGNNLYTQLLTAANRAYPRYNVYTFVSDSTTTPVVAVMDNRIFVDHRYIRDTNITSIVKQIETQVITDNFYKSLNENALTMLTDLQRRMYGTDLLTPFIRTQQLQKQIVYSALFVPGSELAIQLSELDHNAYATLKTELTARAKEKNVAVKNAAYRGLEVYDLTILSRLSADEAISKNLLTGNYSIDDLLARRGPDKERYTFKYGIDASKAGVRVLSAIRHLSNAFGFETDINNFYQALSDIKNPDKYKNFAAFEPILNQYKGFSYDQAINLYLRDQFDFEIDPRGNILATSDIATILDIDKVSAAYAAGKPIALKSLLTPDGAQMVSPTDCIITFVENLRSGTEKAGGITQTSVRGKGLIQLDKNTKFEKQYKDCAHEIQHYLTWNNHQPFGATALFRDNILNVAYNGLSKTEQVPFLRDMLEFIVDSTDTTDSKRVDYAILAKSPDDVILANVIDANGNIDEIYRQAVKRAVYWRYDVDETQSNFNIMRTRIDAPGAYFRNTAIGPIVLRVTANGLTGPAEKFLSRFDGKSILLRATNTEETLNRITNGTATFDELIANADTQVVTEVAESITFDGSEDTFAKLEQALALHGTRPTVQELCQPRFWAAHCTDDALRARVSAFTPNDCKQLVTRLTGLVFDDFQGKFVKPEDMFKTAEYIKYIDASTLVLVRDDVSIIQLPRDYAPNKYPSLDRALGALTTDQLDSAVYYVDDRIFTNSREAIAFTDTSTVSASQTLGKPNNPLLAIFDQFIDSMQQTGFTHAADFALVTHDGKVISYNSNGKPGETLKMFATKLGLPWAYLSRGLKIDPTTGEYVGNLESGILKQLLDAKKVMRAYRVGNTWEAFGKPNYVQDLLLRQMNATNQNVSYLTPGDGIYEQYISGTYRLVVNTDGKVAIDRGQYSKYPEVSWKNNTWYTALMQIIEKYDIRKLSELKQLGFNDDFIDGIKRNYGRSVQKRTAGKLGLGEELTEAIRKYSGLEQDVINQFINDASAHSFARNLLIQNAQARKSTDNLNWSLCSHIRSVEDVDAYLQALIMYSGTLQRKNNNKKYASLKDLMIDAKNMAISSDTERTILSLTKLDKISYDNIVSLFLNIDSRQESKTVRKVAQTTDGESSTGGKRMFTPEGLDFSLSGFQAAAGNLLRGYASTKKSADDVGGKTVSSDQQAAGRHADDETSVNLADTSSVAIAKSILESAETKLDTQENMEYLRTFQRGVAKAVEYLQSNKQQSAIAALGKLQAYLTTENQKVTAGEADAWDPYLKQLSDSTARLIQSINAGQTQRETSKQSGLDNVISEAKARIKSAEDKRAAQDTEYQLLTNNRLRLIRQYGEKGYHRALEALGTKAIFGEDAQASSNVKDNISKRLRDSGSASIYERINKLFDGPAKTHLTSLADNLNTLNNIFKGVKPGTAEYSTMRFKYSNLLTKYYEFLKLQSRDSKDAKTLFAEIKADRLEIAEYLDRLVLTGNYNFNKIAKPEIVLYIDAAEQLASGNITMDEFADFKDASFETRIQTLQALIDAGLQANFPRSIIARMEKILADANIATDITESIEKPRIDLSVLKLAQSRAGLSTETSDALNTVVNKLNQEYKENKSDKAKMSEMHQTLRETKSAVDGTTYMTWTYDRLSKEYRKYLNSPAITQAEAEQLVAHAATMIRNADYQSTANAFRERAKKAWKHEKAEHRLRTKAILYYSRKGVWPKYYTRDNEPSRDEIVSANNDYQNYIADEIRKQELAASEARPIQKSAIQPEVLSEETRANRAEYIRKYVEDNLYENLTSVSAEEAYTETTKMYKNSIERTVKHYLRNTNSSENVDYILAQLGYTDNPLEDPVKVREIAAILDLFISRLKGDISQGTYIYERDRALSRLRDKSLDETIRSELDARKAQLSAAADALWWNSYNRAKKYTRPTTTESTERKYTVPTIRRHTNQVQSVQELLQMYGEFNEQVTPSLDDLPITQTHYTKHRTFDGLLEMADAVMSQRKTNEFGKLNSIINGVSQALTEFQYRPMTLASAIKFITDVRTVLQDNVLNQTLFSWKNNVPTEKLARTAFTEFTRSDTERVSNTKKSEDGEKINTWKTVAEGTSITSINNLLKYLDSGKFTSRAQELEDELKKSAEEISGAVQTMVAEMKEITVTESDMDLESDLSRQMRQEQEAEWAAALADAFGEIIEDINESLSYEDWLAEEFADVDYLDNPEAARQAKYNRWLTEEFADVEDINESLVDDEFEFGFEDDSETTEKPEETEPKKKKSKKEDTRPIDEQFKSEDEASRSSYKTTRSDLLTRNGIDIARALEYQFRETTSIDIYGQTMDRQRVNTQEFITNPEVSKILSELLNNEQAMKDYLVWLGEARAMDEVTSLKALIILNKIEASPTVSFEIRREAQKIRKFKKSIAGAILGLGNRHGLIPVEEVNLLAMEMFKLTKDELAAMAVIKDKQKAAIDAKDFNAADAAMKEALKIFKKHQHELDVSLNPFGKTEHSDELAEAKHRLTMAMTDAERKAIQEEVDRLRELVETERAARWHNLTSKITTWRYFAMLSAPSTFFAKNLAGNYVAQGLNRVASAFASRFEKLIAKKRGFKYTRTGKRASESAVAAVDKQLVASGLLDGMMSNTVAKYDTGYVYRPSAVRNLTIDAVDDNLDPNKLVTLQQVLRADSPFGKFDENGKTNIFAAGLNKMYGIIFGTMDKYDKKFMRADILRLTEQLVSDNFSEQELSELTSNTMSEATLNKFYEIVEYSRQEACKVYFRSQPKIYNDIMQLLHKYPIAQAIVSTIMPFPRMVVNATMTALAYSPFGYLKMLTTLIHDKSMFANIRASQEFGRATTGTIALIGGIILAAIGVLDIDEEDPYTGPQLTLGDLRIALEGLEPSAVPFITGAMFVLGPKYDNTGVFASAADALLESTVLGEMMSQFGNDDTGTKWIGSLFSSYVTQFIPTILRRVTQVIDPGKKNYSGKAKMIKRIAAAIPFLSLAVEDKIDPYTGDTQVQYTDAGNEWLARFLVIFNAVSPTKISWNSDSDVEIESKAVDAATNGPAQIITKKGIDYKIPKKLYNQYKILRAQLYSQYASELIKTDAYKKLSNEKKAQKLKALQTRATNEARKQLNINSELNIP